MAGGAHAEPPTPEIWAEPAASSRAVGQPVPVTFPPGNNVTPCQQGGQQLWVLPQSHQQPEALTPAGEPRRPGSQEGGRKRVKHRGPHPQGEDTTGGKDHKGLHGVRGRPGPSAARAREPGSEGSRGVGWGAGSLAPGGGLGGREPYFCSRRQTMTMPLASLEASRLSSQLKLTPSTAALCPCSLFTMARLARSTSKK